MTNKIKNISILNHILKTLKYRGFFYIFILICKQFEFYFNYIFNNKYFIINNNIKIKYFINFYNRTWLNERCIEIALAKYYINKFHSDNILEIGNVMSHYSDVYHTVIDKYENALNVYNYDVADFKLDKKFNLIISLSTMEHVGWDEDIKDPNKILLAINNLKNHLTHDGFIIITLPIGYNTSLDLYLKNNMLPFDYYYAYIKTDKFNWIKTELHSILDSKYDFESSSANAIVVGFIGKTF
jgi:hypothetical protein